MPPEEQATVQTEGSGGADAATGSADAATGRAEGEPAVQASAPPAEAPWRKMLPNEFQGHTALKDYKDFGSFVKSHVNLVGLLGREPRVPAKDAPPDQWNQFYTALGRPDTSAAYQLPDPPEGLEADPKLLDGFKSAAHTAGLTNSQAHRIAEWFYSWQTELDDTMAAEMSAYTERVDRELRREYGTAYDNNIRLATKFAKDFGGQELVDWLDQTGVGSNPHLIRAFVKAARSMSEDRLGPSRPSDFGWTPTEAKAEIARLPFDKDFQTALHDSQHPGHKAAVERKRALFAAAYPTEEPA